MSFVRTAPRPGGGGGGRDNRPPAVNWSSLAAEFASLNVIVADTPGQAKYYTYIQRHFSTSRKKSRLQSRSGWEK